MACRNRPNGAQECSHGWSAAQPVEELSVVDFAAEGRRKRSVEHISFVELDPVPFLGSNDAADVRIEALCDIGSDPPLAVLG